ncbi:hypothetical protein [Streptomyces sp. TR02-1]|uniref:hypothetical protein n=1 Tax=Streptomyces sp. TR02-1 TaxID=3385977 RepID=UPI0039A241B5
MAGRIRLCAYIHCTEPLPATSRSDKQFCSAACKAAARRWRRHYEEAVEIGLWLTLGAETAHVVRCPACGRRFALGHGHRRDSVYCCHACRQAAYRSRKASERVRESVTPPHPVTAPRTRYAPVTSET